MKKIYSNKDADIEIYILFSVWTKFHYQDTRFSAKNVLINWGQTVKIFDSLDDAINCDAMEWLSPDNKAIAQAKLTLAWLK